MDRSRLLEIFDSLVVPTTQAGYIVNLPRRKQRIVIPQDEARLLAPLASCPLLFQWPQA